MNFCHKNFVALYQSIKISKNTTLMINIKNRKAAFEYSFIKEYEAGIQLTGSEIKSVRVGKVNLVDAFCGFSGGKGSTRGNTELFVRNMHIATYNEASYLNHEPLRPRKLLLKKIELRKIETLLQDRGTTLIATEMYFTDRGFAKLKIAVAKGKKLYDKRNSLKEKDTKREVARSLSE
jgi:SsrA-binding protein